MIVFNAWMKDVAEVQEKLKSQFVLVANRRKANTEEKEQKFTSSYLDAAGK